MEAIEIDSIIHFVRDALFIRDLSSEMGVLRCNSTVPVLIYCHGLMSRESL